MFLKHAKMRRDLFALIISTGIITVSCSPGSSGGGAAASATGVSGSIAAGASKIKAALPGGSTSFFPARNNLKTFGGPSILTADMGSVAYSAADITGISSSFDSPKSFLEYLVNESPEDNPSNGMGVFQRYRQKVMQAMCAFTVLLPDTNSDFIPDVGTHTATIPTSISPTMSSRCPEVTVGMFSGAGGETVSAVITDVSGLSNSNYDIKGVITGSSGAINGASMGQFYFRSAGGVTRFLFLEPGSSLAMFEYSGNVARFEYIANTSQQQHFRMAYNDVTGLMGVYGYEKNASQPNFVNAVAVANMLTPTQATYSFTSDSTTTDHTDGRACFEPADGLTHLGTWAGACTSITGVDLASTPAIVSGLTGLSLAAGDMNQEDEIQFTSATDIVSASFPQ